ncbi:MAG TPA: hypothetical protein VG456_19415, partial [Candidatus Sulfopaludibacter sp.]|nr:hypothetical protein [Candidatus Sulfopaludibacter sp.]
NARIGNGISGVGAGDFRAGRFSSVGRVSGEQVRSAGLVRGQMPIAPSSANLHYANHAASFTPRTNENTRFFSHQQVQAAQRVPFSQQQRAMGVTSNGGTPAANRAPAAQNQMRSAPQAARPSQNGAAGNSGWRRFGEPSGNAARAPQSNPAMENTRPSQAPNSGGWQRFGTPSNGNAGNANGQRFGTPNNSRQQSAPRYNAPSNNSPRYNAPSNNAPRYSAPQQQRSAPSYSAPRYSVPQQQRSAPSYSAPRSNGGGGGGNSRPSGGGGGGGSHSSGGNNNRGRR